MSGGSEIEEGFVGGVRLGLSVFLAGFLPPFLIVWLLTARSQNQLLAEELGIDIVAVEPPTLWERVHPMLFAGSVALGWVILIGILLLVLRSFGRFGALRDLQKRRATDRMLARETKLSSDAWGAATLRKRGEASTAIDATDDDEADAQPETGDANSDDPPSSGETDRAESPA